MHLAALCLVLVISGLSESAFPAGYERILNLHFVGDAGEPLILTPFIEEQKIEEARTAAKVNFSLFGDVESYSGFLTVDKNFSSNLFFWFFPALNDYGNAPVLLWLQGGPGASSLSGLFTENGPFKVESATEVTLRPETWVKNHSVIYIDNPVGTGFSFTDDGYAQNETKVGEDLYSALIQFFILFPELKENEFYVTGESYAGKYIPAISYTILSNSKDADLPINLKGLAIGNGLCDPGNQLRYGEYLYQIGLIDSSSREYIKEYEKKGIEYIKNNQYDKAFEVFDNLINGDLITYPTIYKNMTGFDNYFNYLYPYGDGTSSHLSDLLSRDDFRAAIHVGNLSFGDGNVEVNLKDDVMQSVAPWIAELLSNYRVLFYNGQLDVILAYPLTENFLQNLRFSSAKEYEAAVRHPWYVDNDLAGYVKQAGNLTEVLVRNAGHMVPSDQPRWANELITKFTRNEPLTKL